MKNKTICKSFTLLLSLILVLCNITVFPVQAGTSEIVLDSGTISDELSEAVWNNPMGDVLAEAGNIVFPENSTEETRLITKTSIKANTIIERAATVSAELRFHNLPENEQFILAFGLKSVESMPGAEGNIEVSFVHDGNLKVGIAAYGENGEKHVLMEQISCGSLDSTKIEAILRTDNTLEVIVDGNQIGKVSIPTDGTGRIGFLQTGSCHVTISDINVISYRYATPENCDIYEDFESGTINKNLLTSKLVYQSYTYFPTKASIEEYNGNQVFMFCNTGAAYIGTMHQYSNFEISFDVPYLARVNELDEEGNIIKPKSEAFGIAFGGEAPDYTDFGYTTATDLVIFRNTSAIESMNGKYKTVDSEYRVFDPGNDRPFSVKVTMMDSVVTVYLKWMEETQYKEVLSYQLSKETPTGYVQIWTTGLCNFAIDNLQINNLDINPNLIEVEYASALIEKPEDFDYQPMEAVYLEENKEESFQLYYYITPAVAFICVIVVGTVWICTRKQKKKDGVSNE